MQNPLFPASPSLQLLLPETFELISACLTSSTPVTRAHRASAYGEAKGVKKSLGRDGAWSGVQSSSPIWACRFKKIIVLDIYTS